MDWKSIIAALQKHYSQAQIAALCGCSQSAVSDLAKGHIAQPRHSLGEALKDLLARAEADVKAA